MIDFAFRTEPFKHQLDEFEEHALDINRAIFWEQGTGKTKLELDTFSKMFLEGMVDTLFVLAPSGVHRNWVTDEAPKHVMLELLEKARMHFYQTAKASTKWHAAALAKLIKHNGPVIVAMSYDAIMTGAGRKFAKELLTKRRCLYVLDEATTIKTPSAKRTIRVLSSGIYAKARRLLDGTPITQGPFDLYAPLKFLDEDFWKRNGLEGYIDFKQHFGVWWKNRNSQTGQEFSTLRSYRRLDELNAMIQDISSRVTKESAGLNLPPKLYRKAYHDLTPEQSRLYREIRDEFESQLDKLVPCTACEATGGVIEERDDGDVGTCEVCEGTGMMGELVTADLAMVRLLRLQQIVCGYIPPDTKSEPIYDIGPRNLRVELTMEEIERSPGKVIVWARFKRDLDLILAACEKAKIPAMRYDGSTSQEDRARAIAALQGYHPDGTPVPEERQIKVFAANQDAAGVGLTLHAANTTIYHSNSFKLRARLQSEDRNHRIGQHHPVLYVDIVAAETVDEKIIDALVKKLTIASQIIGDKMKEWL